MDGVTGERSRGSRELVRVGVGNMVAACFGGIASGVNLGASIANHRAGGRTRLASLAAAAVILLTVLFLGPAIALLPRVVIAGMLLVVGVQLFDQWSLKLLWRTIAGDLITWRRMALDLLVALLVAASILVFDPVVGVAMGVTVAVLFFIVRMSRSVVRRTYRGDAVRSRKARDPKLMEILAAHGQQIVVFELEGPIFFGTAEGLATACRGGRARGRQTGGARPEARQRGRHHRRADPDPDRRAPQEAGRAPAPQPPARQPPRVDRPARPGRGGGAGPRRRCSPTPTPRSSGPRTR